MRNIESFKIGLKGLQSNKMRAALTMLGIVFGVAAVIAMMSIGEGAKQETLLQIELMGTNNIIITKVSTVKSEGQKASFSPGLTMKDGFAIKEIIPFVDYVIPQREMNTQIFYKSNMLETKVIGTTEEYFDTYNATIDKGSFFKSFHIRDYTSVCVIGSGVKDAIFKFENPINKKIKIGDLWFEIIGVTGHKNVATSNVQGIGLRNFNLDVYIPITTMMFKMDYNLKEETFQFWQPGQPEKVNVIDRNSIDQLTIKVKNSEILKEASHVIKKIMSRRHYGVKDYEIILPEQLLEQKQKTQRIFNIVMGAIAGISLIVGGIGIMNIMLANILERTREIGIRRAVGATRLDVLAQFMYEALTISIAGGLLGIILGFILTSLISTYAEWKTIISPLSVFLAFVVSVTTGLIFGIYPAKQAADKNPIESLRYE